METLHTVYLALGSNLGDKEDNILQAVSRLKDRVGQIMKLSSLIKTLPVGFISENAFLNAAVALQTTLTPTKLLDATQQIERAMGRRQKSAGGVYHDRIIDIDILLYDNIAVNTERLTIPHPLMLDRDFVMIPLLEIADSDPNVLTTIKRKKKDINDSIF